MSVMAKRLDGLRRHLVWRFSSAQATLCSMGTQYPPEKGQTAGCVKVPLFGTEVGNVVVDGDPPHPSPKRGEATNFRPTSIAFKRLHGSMMPFGMEVGLGLRDIVLDGDPAPPPLKVHSPQSQLYCAPIFGQCPLWPNGWMDQDATWYRG